MLAALFLLPISAILDEGIGFSAMRVIFSSMEEQKTINVINQGKSERFLINYVGNRCVRKENNGYDCNYTYFQ